MKGAGYAGYGAAAAGLVLVGMLAGGCSVLLDPERLDDVSRCRYDDDCPDLDDPRFELVCTRSLDEDAPDIDYPHVCVPRTAASCDPEEYPYASPFRTRHREAMGVQDLYIDRCAELGGVQGCVPGESGCIEGLAVHSQSRRCDDVNEATPPALPPADFLDGQDVLDQFCRSLYCDVEFTCDLATRLCVRCELGLSLGHGGCGDVYFGGTRSPVYQTQEELDSACLGAQMREDDVQLGPVGTAPQ